MGPYELLARVVRALEGLGVPYLVTGSVASMAYGEPRLTNDIDIVARVEERHVAGLLEAFPRENFYTDEEMIREAIARQGQFNIIHPASGLKVDFIVPDDTAFNRSRFKRSRLIAPAPDYKARFASPEDVIVKKMEYYREGESEKHLRDITGILKISGDAVDRKYVGRWAATLGLTEIWEAVLKRLAG